MSIVCVCLQFNSVLIYVHNVCAFVNVYMCPEHVNVCCCVCFIHVNNYV